jgi:hypothetical protein
MQIWLWDQRGPTEILIRHAGPLSFQSQWTDCKGEPLLEVQEAKPLGGFKGDALAEHLARHRQLPLFNPSRDRCE